jgi:hypothetical protein
MWVEREPGLKKAYGETSLCQNQTEGTFNTTPYGREALVVGSCSPGSLH